MSEPLWRLLFRTTAITLACLSVVVLFVVVTRFGYENYLTLPDEATQQLLLTAPEKWNSERNEQPNLDRVTIRNRVFDGLNFDNTRLRHSQMKDVVFRNCTFEHVNMSNSVFRDVVFEKSNLNGVQMGDVDWKNVRLTDVNMSGAGVYSSLWQNMSIVRLKTDDPNCYRTQWDRLQAENVQIEDSRLKIFLGEPKPRNLVILRSNLEGSVLKIGGGGLSIRIRESTNCPPTLSAYCE